MIERWLHAARRFLLVLLVLAVGFPLLAAVLTVALKGVVTALGSGLRFLGESLGSLVVLMLIVGIGARLAIALRDRVAQGTHERGNERRLRTAPRRPAEG